jgi:hypothetical protein
MVKVIGGGDFNRGVPEEASYFGFGKRSLVHDGVSHGLGLAPEAWVFSKIMARSGTLGFSGVLARSTQMGSLVINGSLT